MPHTEQSEKKTIVLVDDDQFLLDMYALKFTEGGFAVHAFSDPAAALEALREALNPDIILFDMVMPGMEGMDFLKKVMKENLAPRATFIVLSNQSDTVGIEKARESGVHGYILKANTVPSDVLKQVEEIAAAKGEDRKS